MLPVSIHNNVVYYTLEFKTSPVEKYCPHREKSRDPHWIKQ
jgi:hypothetical protein